MINGFSQVLDSKTLLEMTIICLAHLGELFKDVAVQKEKLNKHGLARCLVRTGYGILEKLWNFEKEIPYMEKLWNLSKTAVPMEKLWNFRFGGKKCVLSLRPDFEM